MLCSSDRIQHNREITAGRILHTDRNIHATGSETMLLVLHRTCTYRGNDVETSGNDLAHTILRGGVNQYGQTIPNYHYEDLIHLSALYAKKDLKNPAIIIDANHSNSNKQYKEQIRIVSEVLHSRNYNPDLRKLVKGVMIESYLLEGRQDISDHMTPGCSITDPCLGWEDTERLIYDIAEKC